MKIANHYSNESTFIFHNLVKKAFICLITSSYHVVKILSKRNFQPLKNFKMAKKLFEYNESLKFEEKDLVFLEFYFHWVFPEGIKSYFCKK